MRKVYWTAYARGDHYLATQQVLDRISAWGILAQVNRYSDLMVSAVVEVAEERLGPLLAALEEIVAVEQVEDQVVGPDHPCMVYLNVRMQDGKGDLSIETPAVPG